MSRRDRGTLRDSSRSAQIGTGNSDGKQAGPLGRATSPRILEKRTKLEYATVSHPRARSRRPDNGKLAHGPFTSAATPQRHSTSGLVMDDALHIGIDAPLPAGTIALGRMKRNQIDPSMCPGGPGLQCRRLIARKRDLTPGATCGQVDVRCYDVRSGPRPRLTGSFSAKMRVDGFRGLSARRNNALGF